ncbi:hypothetical protein LCGC14_3032880, partial [marine sediment metagenome]
VTKTCKAIASAIEWHVRDKALMAASQAIWDKTQERLRKTQNPSFRRASIDGTVAGMKAWGVRENHPDLVEKLESVKGIEWDEPTKIDVGSALIDLFVKTKGIDLVTLQTIRKSRKDSKVIVRLQRAPRDKAGEIKINPKTDKPWFCAQTWLEDQHEYHSLLRPVHLPMVVPPRNWSDMREGGYLNNSKAGINFIKTRAKEMELETFDLTDAYDAVNLMQATPWRVNLSVYSVMSKAWDAGSGIGNVPPKRHEDGEQILRMLPSKLIDMTPEERQADPEFRNWADRQRSIHEFNADLRAEVKNFGSLMSQATRFAQYPAFYHPHKLDWRQRAYPISIFLTPQGDQFNKALIEFSRGKRMG